MEQPNKQSNNQCAKRHTNQSTNQTTNISTNQPINIPTEQIPTNQPIKQSIKQAINQSTNQPINQSSNQAHNQPTNQLICQIHTSLARCSSGENDCGTKCHGGQIVGCKNKKNGIKLMKRVMKNEPVGVCLGASFLSCIYDYLILFACSWCCSCHNTQLRRK